MPPWLTEPPKKSPKKRTVSYFQGAYEAFWNTTNNKTEPITFISNATTNIDTTITSSATTATASKAKGIRAKIFGSAEAVLS